MLRDQLANVVSAPPLALSALDAERVELPFDVAEDEIGAGHGAQLAYGSDHCHPNDDNDPCNGRRKGNTTEHRASDRPVCCHRAELNRRHRRLGVDSGFHRRLCQRSLWRLAYARAVRTTQIANALGGQIFARRGAMDTGHICVGTSAASGIISHHVNNDRNLQRACVFCAPATH